MADRDRLARTVPAVPSPDIDADRSAVPPSAVPAAVRAGGARRREALRLLAVAVLTLIAVAALRAHVAQNFTIPSESMSHTLEPGDQILVDKVTWRLGGLRRGDVVVFDGDGSFNPPNGHTQYVKRVVGLPGDAVACCDPAGRVTVNGKALSEPYVTVPDTTRFGPVPVPVGELFVLGDHRTVSYDSRYRGTVPTDHVLGRAVAVTWPVGHLALLVRDDPLTGD